MCTWSNKTSRIIDKLLNGKKLKIKIYLIFSFYRYLKVFFKRFDHSQLKKIGNVKFGLKTVYMIKEKSTTIGQYRMLTGGLNYLCWIKILVNLPSNSSDCKTLTIEQYCNLAVLLHGHGIGRKVDMILI